MRMFLFLLFLMCSATARADEILVVCGNADGYSYVAEGREGDVLGNSNPAPGWHEDSMVGQLSLVRRTNGQYDLQSKGGPPNSPPNNFYYSEDGCEISELSGIRGENQLRLLAQCPQHVETFIFTIKADGSGRLLSVDIASTLLSTKATAFHSKCTVPK
jgi:hypothetical protein